MYAVDAVVEEQDTHLVLTPDLLIAETKESYGQLIRRAVEQLPRAPGTALVVTREPPARILAIVHDLDREPSWCEAWVAQAYIQAFSVIQAYGFRSVALPLLGTVHGRLDPVRSVELLRQALRGLTFLNLENIWIIAPPVPDTLIRSLSGDA